MPRILSPDPAPAPGAGINLPRPREVTATDQPGRALAQFGSTVAGISQDVLTEVIRQEHKAETLRVKTEAENRYATLRRQVDEAGTAVDARQLWRDGAPRIRQELQRFAEQRGMPELAGELDFISIQHENEAQAEIGKRSFREAADAGTAYAEAKGEAIVDAPTEVEAQRHRLDLHRSLQELAQDNPMVSAGDADRLFNATVQSAATRRVGRLVAEAANDPAALAQLRDRLAEGAFPDLPGDTAARLQASIGDQIEQATRRLERDRLAYSAAHLADVGVQIIDAGREGNTKQLDGLRIHVDNLNAEGFFEGQEGRRVALVSAIEVERRRVLSTNDDTGQALRKYDAGFGVDTQREADTAWSAIVEQKQARDEEITVDTIAGHMRQSGFLAPPTQQLLGRAGRTDNPRVIAEAAAHLQRLRELAPVVSQQANAPDVVELTIANQEAGLTFDEAAETAIRQVTVDARTQEARLAEFDDLEQTGADFLQETGLATSGWFATDAVIPSDIEADALARLRSAYAVTGDLETAQAMAARRLAQTYGETRVGRGGQLTVQELPPELFLPASENIDMPARAEIITKDVESVIADTPGLELPEGGTWFLEPYGGTKRDLHAGELPRYQLWFVQDGVPFDTGVRIRLPAQAAVLENFEAPPPAQDLPSEIRAFGERVGASPVEAE